MKQENIDDILFDDITGQLKYTGISNSFIFPDDMNKLLKELKDKLRNENY